MLPDNFPIHINALLTGASIKEPELLLQHLQRLQAEALFLERAYELDSSASKLVQNKHRKNRIVYMRIQSIKAELEERLKDIPYSSPHLELQHHLLGFPHWIPLFVNDKNSLQTVVNTLTNSGFKRQVGIPIDPQNILFYGITLKRNSFYVSVRRNFQSIRITSAQWQMMSSDLHRLAFLLDVYLCYWLSYGWCDRTFLRLLVCLYTTVPGDPRENPPELFPANFLPIGTRLIEELLPNSVNPDICMQSEQIRYPLFQRFQHESNSILKRLILLYRYKSLRPCHFPLIAKSIG